MYNIVTNKKVNMMFRGSKYFKTDLGRSFTVREKDDKKSFNISSSDEFMKAYFQNNRIIIYKEGSIGTLTLYTNHYMKDNVVLLNYNTMDFEFPVDKEHIISKGIDDYIGFMIKEIETKYNKAKEESSKEVIHDENEIIADPSKLFSNPGSVNYEDIIAYQKNKKLFKQ